MRVARYFDADVTSPAYTVPAGLVTLNPEGHATGLGCDLDREALQRVTIERVDIKP